MASDYDGSDYGSISDDEILEIESNLKRKFPGEKGEKQHDGPPQKRSKSESDTAASIAREVLQRVWRFPAFRLAQEAAITRLIHGKSATVIFPTGGGKSLVYQVPALAFDEYDIRCGRSSGGGVTLVISPLIALMKDQVDALRRLGVEAAAMDSSQSREVWLETCQKLKSGVLKLLYVAPERLQNEGFVAMINATKIRMVAVDEAHCVSQWGHAFRPDYLKVARFVKEVQAERVLCLTATATPQVAQDICVAFGIEEEGVFRTTSYRSNLSLRAQSKESEEEKLTALRKFLKANKGPTIVYVQTHDQTDRVCNQLQRDGFNAYGYHAGMAADARSSVQEKFMKAKDIVIVATIAFGMGIDKADIRNIVHYAIPKSLEGYSQEIGRAGRDGLASTCMIYICAQDIAIMEEWSRADVPSLRSVKGLVGDIFSNREAKPGAVIERDLNAESKKWDIRRNALDLLNAHLELHFELIRAITPKYSKYQYRKNPGCDQKLSTDNSKTAVAIRGASKLARINTTIDIDEAAQAGKVRRDEVVRKLQEWHDYGWIDLQPSGVVHRFAVLKAFPLSNTGRKFASGEAGEQVYSACHERFETREKEDMDRVQDVIDFVTFDGCLARELARHFGDESSIPDQGCGNCEFCITKAPLKFVKGGVTKAKVDPKKIEGVLAATQVRDDARFLARVAFGISSPRVTQERLSKHEVFGSMKECDFEELVKQFSIACE
jgi:RecQ family ATP-dependent DNA helicase